MNKKITLKEIAKKCGVSTATVSFVINNKNRKGISPNTWIKIEKVLTKFGYNVTAVTGKKDKKDFLTELGAKKIIDRKELEGEPKILGKGLWDGVVDTVGGVVLANAISQTKANGIVAACGNAGGIKLNTSVMPFIIRGVKLWGIDSVMISKKRREFIWSQVEKFVDFKVLEKSIRVVNLEELLNIFPKMLKGETSGRILVDLNK